MATKNLVIPIEESHFDNMIEAVAHAESYPTTIVVGEGVERQRVENTESKEAFVINAIKEFLQQRYVRGAKSLAALEASRKIDQADLKI